MKICESCGKEYDGLYGLKWSKSGVSRFCSRKCSNKRVLSKETKEKISKTLREGIAAGKYSMNSSKLLNWSEIIEKIKKTKKNKLLNTPWDDLGIDGKKKRVKEEQSRKCNKCGIDFWNGIPISLEVDHKDGDNTNNIRENLEALCPNCHSQTETWRGRGCRKNASTTISDEEIVKAFCETPNIRQALLKVGMTAKGANYGRVKKALSLYGIDWRALDNDDGVA